MTNTILTKAYRAYRTGDYASAIEGFSTLEKEGDCYASLYLGYMYMNGIGGKKNTEVALKYLNTAVEKGCSRAAFYKGVLLNEAGNILESIASHKMGADAGNISAAYALHSIGKKYPLMLSDVERQKYFDLALEGGHLYAKRDQVHLMFRGKLGWRAVFRSIPLFLKGAWETAMVRTNDPESDKLH